MTEKFLALCRADALREEAETAAFRKWLDDTFADHQELWGRRIATNPGRWAEIHKSYTGKKLKNKKQVFRKQADATLALDFNVNGERYDF